MWKILAIAVLMTLAATLSGPRDSHAFDGRSGPFAQRPGENGHVTPLVPRMRSPRPPRTQDRARDAVRRGEIRPLEDVLARVQKRYPGRVLDVDLDRSRPKWVYRLRVLTREGNVLRIAVDARTARIIGVRGRRSRR